MNNHYLLSGRNEPITTIAFAPEGTEPAYELRPKLDGLSIMPFEFSLKKVTVEESGLTHSSDLSEIKNPWHDYQANSLAWPMMSNKLRDIIEENLTGNEGVDWIACKVNWAEKQNEYNILRFNKKSDVLDIQQTLFVAGTDHILRPTFSLSKIMNYGIFTQPSAHNAWKITSSVFVSEAIKTAIRKAKLTGIDFEKIRVS